jgi:hypothetical protein
VIFEFGSGSKARAVRQDYWRPEPGPKDDYYNIAVRRRREAAFDRLLRRQMRRQAGGCVRVVPAYDVDISFLADEWIDAQNIVDDAARNFAFLRNVSRRGKKYPNLPQPRLPRVNAQFSP